MKTFTILLLVVAVTSTKFPSFVKLCKRTENLNQCIKENILAARPFTKTGLPRLFVPPTDPLTINSLQVNTTTLQLTIENLHFYGMHDYEVSDVDLDLDHNTFKIEFNFKHINAMCEYKLDGSLLDIDIQGHGIANGNATDFMLFVSLDGNRIQKDGKDYIDFGQKDVKVRIDGDAAVYFADLFKNPDLTRAVNVILNEGIKEVIGEFQPAIRKMMTLLVTENISKLFDKYSIDELFPM